MRKRLAKKILKRVFSTKNHPYTLHQTDAAHNKLKPYEIKTSDGVLINGQNRLEAMRILGLID